jgi:hypothetical protein
MPRRLSSMAIDASVSAPVARIAWTTGVRLNANSSAASINTALPISPAQTRLRGLPSFAISHRRRGKPNRALRTHGPKPLHVLQGRYPCVCDGDAEYQPRALSAAPPRQPSHCRAADASGESMTQMRVRHLVEKRKPQSKCWRNGLVFRCEKPDSPIVSVGSIGSLWPSAGPF